MKAFPMLCLVVASQLAGCTTTSQQYKADGPRETRAALSRQLETRIVQCSLPFMATTSNAHGEIRYRYHDGSVTFQTSDPELTKRLHACGASQSGPDLELEGRIQIWPADSP